MGKAEEYKKKIIDDTDSFEGVSGGISPTTHACENYERSLLCKPVMLKTCSTCKYYKETAIRSKTVSICTAVKY